MLSLYQSLLTDVPRQCYRHVVALMPAAHGAWGSWSRAMGQSFCLEAGLCLLQCGFQIVHFPCVLGAEEGRKHRSALTGVLSTDLNQTLPLPVPSQLSDRFLGQFLVTEIPGLLLRVQGQHEQRDLPCCP